MNIKKEKERREWKVLASTLFLKDLKPSCLSESVLSSLTPHLISDVPFCPSQFVVRILELE